MRSVKVAQRATFVTREDRQGGVLVTRGVLAAKVVFEGAGPATQQPQIAPSSFASVGAQGGRIGSSGDDEIYLLGEMYSYAVETIDPCRAHGTRAGLPFSIHEVIDDHRA